MDTRETCLFCAIVSGDEAAEIVAAAADVIAIEDKYPLVPVHVLILTREHLDSAHDLKGRHAGVLSQVFDLSQQIAAERGIDHGYRIATNIGTEGGQSVHHLHFHLLGGVPLGTPDGN